MKKLYCAHPNTISDDTDEKGYQCAWYKRCLFCGAKWKLKQAAPKVILGILG